MTIGVASREGRLPKTAGLQRGRHDAYAKATGETHYLADHQLPDLLHAAVARSTFAHAQILSIDDRAARNYPGVVGVFTAADVTSKLYGRLVCDVPILAREKVRFVGERVVAVVATTREAAEAAASLIEVEYQQLPSVTSIDEALQLNAPSVHEAPWEYPHALIKHGDGPNLQSIGTIGDREATETALGLSPFVVDQMYSTPAVHQGYLEPQGCMVEIEPSGTIKLWCTNKGMVPLRARLAELFEVEPLSIDIQPIPLGGDFGGKGSPGDAPLCISLAMLTGCPVKMVLRYNEELTATNPRHSSRTRVRLGCDSKGRLLAASVETVLDGGAYAGFNPDNGPTHGSLEAPGYRVTSFFSDSRVTYSNTVPKGNMRAPGAPQWTFAFESALDELAEAAGISPADIRRENLLVTGESDALGHSWLEFRGGETLEAALTRRRHPVPSGWLFGQGISIYNKHSQAAPQTSLRLVPRAGGGVRVEVPVPETGTGSHTVWRDLIGRQLGMRTEQVEVVQVSTGSLPSGLNTGGSRVTATIAIAVDEAAIAWARRETDDPLTIEVTRKADDPAIGSYVVQVAQVAVDPETGQVLVLQITSAVDVAEIINPKAFQMQIDGGTSMGFGFACFEDLHESEGQVWAANLGEFKIPSARDVPLFENILVEGGVGVGTANVKNIGESTTPPTAAAIANAVYAASGCRIRDLPITAERVFNGLHPI